MYESKWMGILIASVLILNFAITVCPHHPLDPMRPAPCRDEFMALGFGSGSAREARHRERRERDKRLHSPVALHAPPHTLGYIVGA